MGLTILMLGPIARIAQRKVASPAQVFLRIVQHFVMEKQLVQIFGMNYFLLVILKLILKKDIHSARKITLPSVAMISSFGAKMVPGVFIITRYATVIGIVQMGVMRVL